MELRSTRGEFVPLALILFGKLLHLGWALVLPMFFFPWWGVLAFYVVSSWLVGFLLANIFQLAHCVDRAEFFTPDAPRRGADFELHQLRTTVDIRCRVPRVAGFVHWLMGGLDYQIEHHLAPKLPHTIYPTIAPQLEAACAARDVTYRTHASVTDALRSHARWLREMGSRPTTGDDDAAGVRLGSARPPQTIDRIQHLDVVVVGVSEAL